MFKDYIRLPEISLLPQKRFTWWHSQIVCRKPCPFIPQVSENKIDYVHGNSYLIGFARFAGNKTCIRDVAAQFCIGESTFHRQCGRVMNYLNDIAPNVIKFPETVKEKTSITQQFEQVICSLQLDYQIKCQLAILDFRFSRRIGLY